MQIKLLKGELCSVSDLNNKLVNVEIRLSSKAASNLLEVLNTQKPNRSNECLDNCDVSCRLVDKELLIQGQSNNNPHRFSGVFITKDEIKVADNEYRIKMYEVHIASIDFKLANVIENIEQDRVIFRNIKCTLYSADYSNEIYKIIELN